jgi:acyl-CoA synthetase (AMP-forming)/AMP-acid ligase II
VLQHGHESSPGAVDATAPPFARLFARRAADNPGVTALHTVTVRNRQPTATAHTVGQVWQDTLTLADRLATSGIQPGDRILLSVQGADRFLAAFMATQWVGAIPVPVPSLAELPSRAYELRIASIAADARPSAIFVGDERSQLALSQHQPAAHVFDVGAE